MATIRFSINDLRAYGIEKARLEKIAAALGMEVEKIDGDEATIDITADRPDMLDIVGFGRAASLFNGKSSVREGHYKISNEPFTEVKVSDSVKRVRPFIAAFVAKNVDMTGNRLKYLMNFTEKFCDTYGRKRRKLAIGVHNLDMVKGPLVYSAGNESGFVPLGASKSMSFEEALRKTEKGREYGSLLSESKGLYPYLKDSKNIISLIPITNSDVTKVMQGTKNLFIEITGTSKSAVEQTAALMACSFIDSGADVHPCNITYKTGRVKTPELKYSEMMIKPAEVDRTLGTSLINFNAILALLGRMGHLAAKYGNNVIAYVAPYRLDVLDERDLIEDIAIAYGYDNITPLPVAGFGVGIKSELSEFADRISSKMIGLGFTESMNNNLTNERVNFENMDRDYDKNDIVSIAQAKTEAISMLRTAVLPSLLQNLSISGHEPMPQKLFEIGKAFALNKGKIIESDLISIVSEHPKANFSEIKSVAEAVLGMATGQKITLKRHKDSAFIEGRCASIHIDNEWIGIIGEIAPGVLANFKIDEPVVAAELDMRKLMVLS
ncbi:MAG: phenylalanine--tRNA ligase subunit beta [Candidatus Micrarchaeota archaeon]|nr:phenylalanine--tRNA ligase subunit beta [Candidatus Micrarchaeota archaeon]